VTSAMTATATASGSTSAMARAAGPATTSSYGAASATAKITDGVYASDQIAGGHGALGVPKLFDGLAVGEEVEGFFQRLQVVRTDEDRGRCAVPGDHDPIVLLLDSIDEL
jgi:hypothetical protein